MDSQRINKNITVEIKDDHAFSAYEILLKWWSRRPGFNPRSSHTKDSKKFFSMLPCLTLKIIRYRSRVNWSNRRKGVVSSITSWCGSNWKGSFWITLDCSHQLYLLILYIFQICSHTLHLCIHPYSTLEVNIFIAITILYWLALDGVSQCCIVRTVTAVTQLQSSFQSISSHSGMLLGLYRKKAFV